jgi:hypothetical protein
MARRVVAWLSHLRFTLTPSAPAEFANRWRNSGPLPGSRAPCRSRHSRPAVHNSRGVGQNVGGGLIAPRALPPALPAVAPVMWANPATILRTETKSGPIALSGLLGRNRLPGGRVSPSAPTLTQLVAEGGLADAWGIRSNSRGQLLLSRNRLPRSHSVRLQYDSMIKAVAPCGKGWVWNELPALEGCSSEPGTS